MTAPEVLRIEPVEPSVLRLLTSMVRRWRPLAVLTGLTILAFEAPAMLRPRLYTSTASFVPTNTSSQTARISGLAAQFGLALGSFDNASQSPDFYAELLRSEQLVRALVRSSYHVGSGDSTANLITILGLGGRDSADAEARAMRRVRRYFTVSTALKTSIVTLSLKAPTPTLAAEMSERAVALVNEFNLLTRQTEASRERRFLEDRAREAESALRDAEDRLQGFLQQNREYANSAQLRFQHDRLQRGVATRQQVYTTLVQGLEQARIAEVRNTPVISVVEPPVPAVRPDGRRLVNRFVIALLVSLGLSVSITLGLDRLRTLPARAPEEVAALKSAMRGTAQE